MKIPFIKYANVWYVVSAATVVLSIVALATYGLKLGIDFTGGSLVELSFSKNRPSTEQLTQTLQSVGAKENIIQKSGEDKFIIRTTFLKEDQHQALLKAMNDAYAKDGATVTEDRFETIGAAVSDQLRQRAIWAIIMVNIGIICYVAYAFRKISRPIASWKYGLLAIIALCHDILLVLGIFALLGHYFGIEVEIDFVVALLTVLGFSVTDTIVVYDRIRENLVHHSGATFAETVNNGLNETLMRSINTTLLVLIPLFALYFLGGSTIHTFALALLIGMTSGAYSSIFIASPLLVLVEKWQRRAAARG